MLQLRGKNDRHYPLRFVRVEPYVVGKRWLTGDNTERVDTRVLQVIYALDDDRLGGLRRRSRWTYSLTPVIEVAGRKSETNDRSGAGAMTIHDITIPMQDSLAGWPGDTPFRFSWTWRKKDGATVNVGQFQLSVHTGSHADAPFHYDDAGATIDASRLASVYRPGPIDLAAGPPANSEGGSRAASTSRARLVSCSGPTDGRTIPAFRRRSRSWTMTFRSG